MDMMHLQSSRVRDKPGACQLPWEEAAGWGAGYGVYLGHGVFDRLKNITWHSDFWLSSMPSGLTFWCLMFPPVPVAARPVAVVSLQVQCHPVVV